MKVAHITTVHPPEDVRILFRECAALHAAGFEVQLIAPFAGKQWDYAVPLVTLPMPKNRIDRFTRTQWRMLLACLQSKAKIFHFHDPELIPLGLVLKIFGKKVVYDVHEDVPQQILIKPWINKYLRKLVSNLFARVEALAGKFYDGIVMAVDFSKSKLKIVNNNIAVIRNYPPVAIAQNPNCEKRLNQICYVGDITPDRGIFTMINSLPGTNAILSLAGRFESKALLEACKKLPGWQQVEYHGYIPWEQAKALMRTSMAGLIVFDPIPKYAEALPVKLFEYLGAGIPVITGDCFIWSDIVNRYQCGVTVDPQNCDQIRQAINSILEHPQQVEIMGINGKQAINEKFNWESEAGKLISFYQGLA